MVKLPNFSVLAVNAQRLGSDRKRNQLFSKLASTSFDVFLVSETGRPDASSCEDWESQCAGLGLSSLFVPDGNVALIWRSESPKFTLVDGSINSLSSRLGTAAHATRLCDATFVVGTTTITIVSVYAPNSDASLGGGLQGAFLRDVESVLRRQDGSNELILAGDWNCVEDPAIDSSIPTSRDDGEAMRNLARHSSLSDAFRILCPRKRGVFTNEPPSQSHAQRRLDRVYVSAGLVDTVTSHHLATRMCTSTHKPVVVKFVVPGAVEIGPGKFKLGLHHIDGLEDYHKWLVQSLHASAVASNPDDPVAAWIATKTALLPRLADLSRVLTSFRRRTDTEGEQERRFQSAAIRARLPSSLTAHASVKIRLRQVRTADLTPALKVQGVESSDPNAMLGEARAFFEDLYSDRPTDPSAMEKIARLRHQVLRGDAVQELEADYDLEELWDALQSCNRRSSPGPDGLPFQFYTATWEVTGPILLDALNALATRDDVSLPCTESHIHLLHKQGAHEELGNKRPLSLINTDTRLFSQAHNKRLAPMLSRILEPTQTGFVPGRWIGDNIAALQCAIDAPSDLARDGLVALLDFEKAYDRVAHDYLDKMLEMFNFGPRARRWYRSTFVRQTARVYLNGWLSAPFAIRSGVRQGDPLAPSLFAIAIEGLALLIRNRVRGRGTLVTRVATFGAARTVVPDSDLIFRELLFADDVACGLDDYGDALKLRRAVDIYCRASSSKLSESKSFLYPLGERYRDPSKRPENFSWNIRLHLGPFRYLGIQLGREVDNGKQWRTIKSGVLKRMRSIPMFDLPIATKCAILNIYCFSKIIYYDRFVPAPDDIVADIQQAALDSIWGNIEKTSSNRITDERLYTPVLHGGFGLQDLSLLLRGGRARWVYDLLPQADRKIQHRLFMRHLMLRSERLLLASRQAQWAPPRSWYRKWRWYLPICHPLEGDRYRTECDMLNALASVLVELPPRWHKFFDAWTAFTTIRAPLSNNSATWCTHVVALEDGFDTDIPIEWFAWRGDPAVITPGAFVRPSAALHHHSYPLIMPVGWTTRFPTISTNRWLDCWRFYATLRRDSPDVEDTVHRISLWNLHPASQIGGAGPRDGATPNDLNKDCILCRRHVIEDFEHLLGDCPVSRWIWSATTDLPLPPLVDLVCPRPQAASLRPFAQRAFFVYEVWQLARKRRYARTIIDAPVTDFEARQASANIVEAMSRCRLR